jgi:hypothetical protein
MHPAQTITDDAASKINGNANRLIVTCLNVMFMVVKMGALPS